MDDKKCCALFGHKDCPEDVRSKLEDKMEQLIYSGEVDYFIMGNQGRFDSMARSTAKRLKEKYPHIDYDIVLAYLPKDRTGIEWEEETENTIYPDGLETVPMRFAISRRNRWMVEQADVIICYIVRDWGGAVKAVEYAERKGKSIYNIAKSLIKEETK